MKAVAQSRHLKANILLLFAALIWGLAFVAQRIGAEYVAPFSFNAARFAMGACVLMVVIKVLDVKRGFSRERCRQETRSVILPGAFAGALLAIAVGLQQAAMPASSAGNAAFVTAMYIVLVPIFGVALRRKVSWQVIVGIVFCVFGLYFICVKDQLELVPSDALLLGAAAMFAVQILVVDKYGTRLGALRFSVAQFWGCAVLSGILALFFDQAPFMGFDKAFIPLLYGGICSVGVAYTFQVMGQRDALAAHAALIMSMESVFGALGGALILGENMGLRGYGGALLMVVGIVVSQSSEFRKTNALM